MIKDSALDRLFPESMRYHKGHVADPDHKGGAGARSRLVRLTPRQKLAGIVRRAPEVMLKIGRANIRCLQHMKAAADYISRNGKLEIEDQTASPTAPRNKCKLSSVNGDFNRKSPKRSPQTIVVPTAAGSSSPCRPVRRQRVSKQHAANGLKTR